MIVHFPAWQTAIAIKISKDPLSVEIDPAGEPDVSLFEPDQWDGKCILTHTFGIHSNGYEVRYRAAHHEGLLIMSVGSSHPNTGSHDLASVMVSDGKKHCVIDVDKYFSEGEEKAIRYFEEMNEIVLAMLSPGDAISSLKGKYSAEDVSSMFIEPVFKELNFDPDKEMVGLLDKYEEDGSAEETLLVNEIIAVMSSDADLKRRDEARAVMRYLNANIKARIDIDDIFISLCGWRFKTLISRALGKEE